MNAAIHKQTPNSKLKKPSLDQGYCFILSTLLHIRLNRITKKQKEELITCLLDLGKILIFAFRF